jgi:hypothetical protein
VTNDECQMTKEARMTKPEGNGSRTKAALSPDAATAAFLPCPEGARDSSRGPASLRAQPPVRRAGIVRPGGARGQAPTASREPVSRARRGAFRRRGEPGAALAGSLAPGSYPASLRDGALPGVGISRCSAFLSSQTSNVENQLALAGLAPRRAQTVSSFGLCHSFVIRHSSFVIRHSSFVIRHSPPMNPSH